jgi:hypothetical protein
MTEAVQQKAWSVLGHLAGSACLIGLSLAALLFDASLPAALLGGLGLGLLVKGVLRARTGLRLASPAETVDPNIVAAYDRAREAINSSVRIDAERSLELVGLLRASYDEVVGLEAQRPALVAGLNALPSDGGGAAGQALREAADQLDSRRQSFVDQCTNIQASVAMLGVNPNAARSAIDDLVAATSSFNEEARAAAELEDTIAAARVGRKTPAG